MRAGHSEFREGVTRLRIALQQGKFSGPLQTEHSVLCNIQDMPIEKGDYEDLFQLVIEPFLVTVFKHGREDWCGAFLSLVRWVARVPDRVRPVYRLLLYDTKSQGKTLLRYDFLYFRSH
jgi:hypothetical protein